MIFYAGNVRSKGSIFGPSSMALRENGTVETADGGFSGRSPEVDELDDTGSSIVRSGRNWADVEMSTLGGSNSIDGGEMAVTGKGV